MSAVGMFVHLYHVWAAFGLITAFIYGKSAYQLFGEHGCTWRSLPGALARSAVNTVRLTVRDWWNLLKWVAAGFTGMPWKWPADSRVGWPLSRDQTLLVGITLGGASRLLTALYWSEKNTAWMTEATVWLPAIPIVMAIVADSQHHHIAWEDKPWRLRIVLTLAIAWVFYGATFAY